MTIEIYELSNIEDVEEYIKSIDSWSTLWFSDFETAEIKYCYLAFEGDEIVGFQSINRDELCVAIEVHPEYRGKGVASALVKESNCFKPDRNECPEFWAAMLQQFDSEDY